MIINIATAIPVKIRTWIYAILGVVAAAQGAFHFLPDGVWGKVATFLGSLGFGLAAINAGVTVGDSKVVQPPAVAPADPAGFPLADPGIPLPD